MNATLAPAGPHACEAERPSTVDALVAIDAGHCAETGIGSRTDTCTSTCASACTDTCTNTCANACTEALTMADSQALPHHYEHAEQLASGMLAAAIHGNWSQVRLLQSRIPALAEGLAAQWSAMRAGNPNVDRSLEAQRIDAIRRILRIDAQIRRVADPVAACLERVLAGSLH